MNPDSHSLRWDLHADCPFSTLSICLKTEHVGVRCVFLEIRTGKPDSVAPHCEFQAYTIIQHREQWGWRFGFLSEVSWRLTALSARSTHMALGRLYSIFCVLKDCDSSYHLYLRESDSQVQARERSLLCPDSMCWVKNCKYLSLWLHSLVFLRTALFTYFSSILLFTLHFPEVCRNGESPKTLPGLIWDIKLSHESLTTGRDGPNPWWNF